MRQEQPIGNDPQMINTLITQKMMEYHQAITGHKPFGEAQHLRMEIKELDKKLHMASRTDTDKQYS